MGSPGLSNSLDPDLVLGISKQQSIDSGNFCYTILHLGDDPDILSACKLALEKYGDIHVDSIECPLKALEMIKLNPYDAVITDMWMQKMLGEEFVRNIVFSNSNTPPIIILYSDIDPDSNISYSNLYFICENEPPEILFDQIHRIISNSVSKSLTAESHPNNVDGLDMAPQLKKGTLIPNLNLHDLQDQIRKQETILNSLIGEHQDDNTLIRHLINVLDSSEKMYSLIETVSDEKNYLAFDLRWIDVYLLFQPAVIEAEKNGIITSIEDDYMEVFSHFFLEKIFLIFIENSLRHGKKVSAIHMSSQCTEQGLLLIYEDNGIGVPVEHKEKIFLKDFGKNQGLGLYFVRSLCHLLGITIRENGKPDRGVRFELTFPPDYYRQIIPTQ